MDWQSLFVSVAVSVVISILFGLVEAGFSGKTAFTRVAAPKRFTRRPTIRQWTVFLVQCGCLAGIIYFAIRIVTDHFAP